MCIGMISSEQVLDGESKRLKQKIAKDQTAIVNSTPNHVSIHQIELHYNDLTAAGVESEYKCFTRPQSFVLCEMNDSLTGDEFYENLLLDGSTIVLIDSPNMNKVLKATLLPEPKQSKTFKNFSLENTSQPADGEDDYSAPVRMPCTSLKLTNKSTTYENKSEQAVYENVALSCREVKLFTVSSLDQVAFLYEVLRETIGNPTTSPIPILFRMTKFSVGLLLDYAVGSSPIVNNGCGAYSPCSNFGDVCRLNCSQPFQKSRYVVLFSNAKDNIANVAEFQIYGDDTSSYSDRYMGCFQKFLSTSNQGSVILLYQCLGRCSGNLYAGVMNGKDCYCSNTLIGDLASSDHCGVACSSDDHLCGATGYFAVYNDCSVNNGMCVVHTCKTNLIGPSSISECVCNVGYYKNFYSDDCREVNKCSLNANLCPVNISTCVNTPGSYICNCTDGYVRSGQNNCTVILNLKVNQAVLKEGMLNNSSSNTSAIIGGVVGASVALLLIVGIFVAAYFCKRKKNQQRTSNSNIGQIISRKPTIKLALEKVQKNVDGSSSKVPIGKLENYYKSLTLQGVFDQFRSVPVRNNHSSSYAEKPELNKKNKSKEIVPFDENRVKLKTLDDQPFSDYINASIVPVHINNFQWKNNRNFYQILFFQSYRSKKYSFIATESPNRETMNDYWRMICEKDVQIIIILNLRGQKSKDILKSFLPDLDEKLQFKNNISVKCVSLEKWPTYEIRKFYIKMKSQEFMPTCMGYTGWPDGGLSNNVGCFLNFHHRMKSVLETKKNFDKNHSNIVVQCETGVGTSGIFIGLNYLIEQCEDKSMVDVLQCLRYLRSHRNHMIQTEEEYDFLYKSMIAYHNLGHTTCFSINEDSFTKFLSSETFNKSLEIQFRCFNKSNAFLTCEIGKNLKGSVLYDDVLAGGSIIVVIDSKPTKQSALQLLIPDSGRKLTFHKMTVENNDETNRIYETANCINNPSTITLTLTMNDDKVKEDEIYEDDNVYNKLSNHGRSIKIHSLESINQIQSLYNLLKDSIKNPKSPAIPLIYKNSEDSDVNAVLVMLSVLEMMDSNEQVDVYQAVRQLQPLRNSNHSSHKNINYYNINTDDDVTDDVYSYNNDDVFVTMKQYRLIHEVVGNIVGSRK
ncbi:hypothetical protein HELRODRAFT_163149 [Helobdella robusta]|uniref:Tyrosine-protein phosphatase domain-containing protein n=1 Tax=Helobdella robusta TaxID=6412 RepID=T1ETQ5_HELRO|nr:hypothetical protein HELRODRAFT_163149 [Helobdella robusta]ESN96120.1 hypothetical protein HELRODRAFT_163149 [Helobdella robusta]